MRGIVVDPREPPREDRDDGVRLRAEAQRLADHLRDAAKVALPRRMADDDTVRNDASLRAGELARQRSKALAATATELARGSAGAARALVAIAKGEAKGSTARVAAAKAVLDAALRLEEHGELVRRMEAIEAQLGGEKSPAGGGSSWRQ